MKRAIAHNSSCSQVSLVYLVYPSILFQFTMVQPKIAKIHQNPPILGFKVNQDH